MDTENLNIPVTTMEIEGVVNNLPKKENAGNAHSIISKLIKSNKQERNFPNSISEASVTLFSR